MKKIKIEYLLYIFIILCPILDATSFLFREHFSGALISPSTIIRPIIPLILLCYVFFKDKNERLKLLISGLVYVIYGVIHLYIYHNNMMVSSFGNVLNESQYIINYTYMVYVLYLYFYFRKNINLDYLKKSIYISLGIYLGILFISILTGTSSSTYLEGMGYKGWFLQGNALCTILLLMMCIILPDAFKNKKWYKFLLLILLGIYLMFLVGTRTGLFGYILVLGLFIILYLYFYLKKKKKINYKVLGISLGCICAIVVSLFIFGSSTISRREHIKNENAAIIDVNTMEVGHTTGDTGVIVKQIRDNTLEKEYMSDDVKNAYVRMYEKANKREFNATDKRRQQLYYHSYLISEQNSIVKILFGNGYLIHYGEMILEIELIALLYNFGVIGFMLYFIPFFYMFINVIKRMKKKDININKVMYIFSFLFANGLSLMAGYVYFNVSCTLILICNLVLLDGEKS